MASIRKRGSNSYLIVVSRGYDYEGNRLKSVQKTVKPPKEYTPKQAEKWVKEQAILFEREVQHTPEPINRSKSSILWGAALFVLHRFYGAVKEGIRTARAPRFASRGAETPQWGVSRARLGESLRAHSKTSLQCVFTMRFFL